MTTPTATLSPLFALLADLSDYEVEMLEERTGTDLAAVTEQADRHEARMLALEALTMGLLDDEAVADAIAADLAERLNANPGGDDLAYAKHYGSYTLGCGDTFRKREGCSHGEVRVIVELDEDDEADATACVVTLWHRDGEPFYGDTTVDGVSLDDVAVIRAAIDTAIGAP